MMRILCRLGHHKYRLFLVSKRNGWTFAETCRADGDHTWMEA